jgi:hypothetical protein
MDVPVAYPHRSMQGSCDFVILLQPWTASKNLGQPELAHSALHMADLTLGRRRSLHPLRGLPSHTADHVGMGKSLWRTLLRLDAQRRRDGLCDAGMQRRGPARDDEILVVLIACTWTAIAVGRARSHEGRVGAQ